MTTRIPLFPLHTVLFPGGPLPLRVFEPRYLGMISRCLQQGTGFGVCLIREGDEVGGGAKPYHLGTFARIVDWEQRSDGLLGITVHGERRFVIRHQETDAQRLLLADVEFVDEYPPVSLPFEHHDLGILLRRIREQLGGAYTVAEPQYEDAGWIACRLTEILPLPLRAKQRILEIDDPLERLSCLREQLQGGDD